MTHLSSQLSSGDAQRAKHALQDICRMYRAGHRFRPDSLPGIEIAVVGLLATRHSDPKLRRWSLNAIAQFGRKEFCLSQTLDIFRQYGDDPETVASAVAAIYKMTNGNTSKIAGLDGADQKLVFLSALQVVSADRLSLPMATVSVDQDHPEIVKAATILVGLNRAPPNLFDPAHENSVLLKALGAHHDPMVSQYSVWAIAENPQLGFRDLGIDMKSVDDQRSNVRSWMYRLLGMSEGELAGYREFVELGMGDNSEVRLGLATGMRDSFQDWLEPQMREWHLSEPDDDVRNMLLDHVVRQSHRATTYAELATQLYTSEPAGSAMRKRMEANALGLPLYQKLKAIEYRAQPNDLFSYGGSVSNNITINGGVQGGAVSLTGNASNPGSAQIHYQPQTIEAIRAELSRALVELEKLDGDAPSRDEAIAKVREAQAEPTADRLGAAARIVTHVSDGLSKVAGAGNALASSGQALLELWSKLPPIG